MAIDLSRLQYLLSQNDSFLSRVQIKLCTIAAVVLAEPLDTVEHEARSAFARQVIANPAMVARNAGSYLAQSTNVRNTITYENEGVRTTVLDADLESQISHDWNILAGIDTGA